MAVAGELILTRLGFEVDGISLKSSLEKVAAFGSALRRAFTDASAAFAGIAKGEADVAAQADALGVSVGRFAEWKFIAEQTGASAEALEASLKAMLANNPGIADAASELERAGGAMREMGDARREAYALELGIDPSLIPMLTRDVSGLRDMFRSLYATAGTDAEQAAEDGKGFLDGMARLAGLCDLLGKTVALSLLGTARSGVEALGDAFVAHFDDIRRVLELVVALASAAAPVIGAVLGQLVSWGGQLAGLLGMLDADLVAGIGKGIAAFMTLRGAVGAAIIVFANLKEAWTLLTAALSANPWMLALGALVALAVLVIENWDGVKGFFIGIWDAVASGVRAAGDAVASVFGGALDVVSGLLSGLGAAAGAALEGFVNGLRLIGDLISAVFSGDLSGALDAGIGLFTNFRETAAGVFSSLGEAALGVFSSLWGKIAETFPGFGAWASDAAESVGSAVSGAVDALAPLASGALDAVSSAVSGTAGALGSAFSGAVDAVTPAVSGAAEAVGPAVSGVAEAVSSTVSGLAGAASSVFSGVTERAAPFVSGIAESVGAAVSGTLDVVGSALSGAAEAVGPVASDLAEAAGSAFGRIAGSAGSAFSGAVDAVTPAVSGAAEALSSALGGAVEAVSARFPSLGAAAEAVGQGLASQFQGIRDLVDSVFSGDLSGALDAGIGLFSNFRETASGVFAALGEGILGVFASLWGQVAASFPDFGAWAASSASAVAGAFGKALGWVRGKLQGLIGMLPDWAQETLGWKADSGAGDEGGMPGFGVQDAYGGQGASAGYAGYAGYTGAGGGFADSAAYGFPGSVAAAAPAGSFSGGVFQGGPASGQGRQSGGGASRAGLFRPDFRTQPFFSPSTQAYLTASPWQAAASSPGSAVSLESRTEINVSGAGSPEEVARRVAVEQGNINADLIRHVQGAAR